MKTFIPLISGVFFLGFLASCDDGGTKNPEPICGNGIVEGAETCDGSDFAGLTCTSLGRPDGELSCTELCTMDLTECREHNLCGDGIRDDGEACEENEFGTMSCANFGYDGGTLACTVECNIDATGCHDADVCGNGTLETGEACDGEDFGSLTCASFGLDDGTLSCSEVCTIDTSSCTTLTEECGDGILQPANGESCDGDALGGNTCLTQGFSGGVLACLPDCRFDTSGCEGSFLLTGRVWGPGADNVNMRAENWFPVAGASVIAFLSEPPAPAAPPAGLCIACQEPPVGVASARTAADGTFELQLAPNENYWLVVEKGAFRRVSQFSSGNVGETESLEPAIGNPRNPITTLPNRNIPASRQWIPRILVVQGSFENVENLFRAQGFNYGVEIIVVADTAASGIFNDLNQLRQYHMILTTDGDDSSFLTQPAVRSNLRQYVSEGGKLFVDDFSYDHAEQPFPEFLSFMTDGATCGAGISASDTLGECNSWSSYNPAGTPGDTMLAAWLNGVQGVGPFQLLGSWNIIGNLGTGLQGNCDDVNDIYCIDGSYLAPPKVWMYGDWSTYTQKPLTVSWNYYCGRVLYTVVNSHFTGTQTGFDYLLLLQEKIMMYLMLEMQTCTQTSWL
jgi:hypothetical protein